MSRSYEDYNRDILSEEELEYMAAKISAGAEMKTAIKKFLDRYYDQDKIYPSDLKELKKAMEKWCNIT